MKKRMHLPLLLAASLVWIFSFQSCTETGTSATGNDTGDTTEEPTGNTGTTTTPKAKKHSEMSVQEQSDYIAQHADQLAFVDEKMIAIKNEKTSKKDYFIYKCAQDSISLERIHNEKDEIHLLSYSIWKGNTISTKHHFFWEDKLIYQFYHHEVEEGGKQVVDDHKTFFKDGKMIKCLEKRYSYTKGKDIPHTDYTMADCVPADKLTKDIEKLLSLSEADAKSYFCN